MMRISTRNTAAIAALLLVMALISACKKTAGDCSEKDDATLAANVKAALEKKMPKLAKNINVEVKDKVVTLTGHLSYSGSQTLAHDTAKGVECVKDVVNKIALAPEPACGLGDHQCCCPDTGCECVPQSQQCNICNPK